MTTKQDITGIEMDADGSVNYTYGYDTYIVKPIGVAEDGETLYVELILEEGGGK